MHREAKQRTLCQYVILELVRGIHIILVEELPSNHPGKVFVEAPIQNWLGIYGDARSGSESSHIQSGRRIELLANRDISNAPDEGIPPDLRTAELGLERSFQFKVGGQVVVPDPAKQGDARMHSIAAG